jgi:hypothetical protein
MSSARVADPLAAAFIHRVYWIDVRKKQYYILALIHETPHRLIIIKPRLQLLGQLLARQWLAQVRRSSFLANVFDLGIPWFLVATVLRHLDGETRDFGLKKVGRTSGDTTTWNTQTILTLNGATRIALEARETIDSL